MKTPKNLSNKNTLPEQFFTLYNYFTDQTRNALIETFIDAMKILHFRYKRKKKAIEARLLKKKKQTRKSYPLKRTDITEAVSLIDHCLTSLYYIPPERDALKNFGKFPHDDAMRYWQEFVEGEVTDTHGRNIVIDEQGLTFLFDGHDENLPSEKYLMSRGKRLPWIRETLKNTKGVYEHTEKAWTSYYYVSKHNVPFSEENGITQKKPNYFFIVVRKESGKPLKFITAYHFENKMGFYKYLEPSHPFCPKSF